MDKITGIWFLILFLFVPVGAHCAGSEFVPPADDAFTLGKTTYAQVFQQMGDTGTISEAQRNGEHVKILSYAYSQSGRYSSAVPAEEGVSPLRKSIFSFKDDVLVGQFFTSSYKSDSTDFDESKIVNIVKGKTTREEVVNFLGKPSSKYIPPMGKKSSASTIAYNYNTSHRYGFGIISKTNVFSKNLVVSFDQGDIVSDIDFAKSGEK